MALEDLERAARELGQTVAMIHDNPSKIVEMMACLEEHCGENRFGEDAEPATSIQ